MAVDKSSATTVADKAGAAKKKAKMTREKPQNEHDPVKPSLPVAASAPRKRNSCPGVRVVGGRIYDSENGITCHQCRQKTRDFAAACKQIRKGKPCPIHFCHKCLLNRYGEKADEVSAVENWSCPRCRGVCNCSFCMKKKGHLPTGILIHAAKATGFSSVHDLLDRSGADLLDAARGLTSMSTHGCSASVKVSTPTKRSLCAEDAHVGEEDEGAPGGGAYGNGVMNTLKEKKRARKNNKTEENCVNIIKPCASKAKLITENVQGKEPLSILAESIIKEDEISDVREKMPIANTDKISEAKTVPMAQKNLKMVKGKKNSLDNTNQKKTSDLAEGKTAEAEHRGNLKQIKQRKNDFRSPSKHMKLELALPQGTPLTEITGIQWSPQDVGAVLQFLEFCSAFSKVLDIRKGEPEYILREIAKGRVGRGAFPPIIKFHKKLLSFVEKEMGEEYGVCSTSNADPWLQSLVNCINGSKEPLKRFPLDTDLLVYDDCNLSVKLKLLNLLCDKTLDTEKLRNWIYEENAKFIEQKKEAKEIILAAKKKEKDLKQKLKDDFAKRMLSVKDGAPFSHVEHHNHISQIKAEVDKAHAEMLESMKLLPKRYLQEAKKVFSQMKEKHVKSGKHRRDALRTEPILLNGKGHVYWELEGYSDNVKMLLQDIGDWSSVLLEDNWFAYDQEGERAIDKHISSIRKLKQKKFKCLTEKEPENVLQMNDPNGKPKQQQQQSLIPLGGVG